MTDKLQLGPGKICRAPVRVVKTFDDGSIAVEPINTQAIGRALRSTPDYQLPNSFNARWTLEHRTDRTKPKPPLFIDVVIASADPDAPPEQTHRINFNRPASREWLNNLTTWALNTGRTVHLRSVAA